VLFGASNPERLTKNIVAISRVPSFVIIVLNLGFTYIFHRTSLFMKYNTKTLIVPKGLIETRKI